MKIYLSGPITGKAAAAADFKKLAQSARRRYGADAVILSPMRHPAGLTPAAYMRLAFADIDAADVAYPVAVFAAARLCAERRPLWARAHEKAGSRAGRFGRSPAAPGCISQKTW